LSQLGEQLADRHTLKRMSRSRRPHRVAAAVAAFVCVPALAQVTVDGAGFIGLQDLSPVPTLDTTYGPTTPITSITPLVHAPLQTSAGPVELAVSLSDVTFHAVRGDEVPTLAPPALGCARARLCDHCDTADREGAPPICCPRTSRSDSPCMPADVRTRSVS
jgi:hypothetical protein